MLEKPAIWGKNRSELYSIFNLYTICIKDLNIKTKSQSTRKKYVTIYIWGIKEVLITCY